MFGRKNNQRPCAAMEGKLVEYLDGLAEPEERHAVEAHLATCADCRARVEDFRALWSGLDDVLEITPSASFDAALRARIAAEPARRGFWGWIPSPRLTFAVTAFVAMSIWLSFGTHRRAPVNAPPPNPVSAESEFGMTPDLPLLENYDVISKFDALSELPRTPAAPGESTPEESAQ